jgi:ATP-dependent helicase/nuclease subunit B
LLRLETVLSKLFKKNFVLSGKEWRDWARQLYTPEFSIQIPPPSPRPSLHLRPRKLSVTGVEKLIRNPYTIYAAHILKIKPLQKISLELKPSDFGIFVHKALEFFSGENNNLSLLECGKKALGDLINMPVVQNLWWPRFERIASWILKREHDKATKIYSEISGEIQFATKSGPFILTAKADRIEVDQENNIEIIDYKTGSIPSLKDIRVAIAPQMTLEALIALKKGFPLQLTTTTHKIAKLIYIQLSGGEHAGSYTEIKEEIDQLIEEAELGLKDLIDAFSDQNTPYLCCPVPSYAPKYDEYQHLSRSKEWVS